jgi:hypothetical protein
MRQEKERLSLRVHNTGSIERAIGVMEQLNATNTNSMGT